MLKVHESGLKQIWKIIFDCELELSLDQFMSSYCFDIDLPKMALSAFNKQPVTFHRPYKRVIAQAELEEEHEAPMTENKLQSASELISYVAGEVVFCGSNSYESSAVLDSDNIFRSNQVFASRSIFDSKKVLFSTNCTGLESCAACDNSGFNQFCIRVFDSGSSSRCFELYQSAKCTNSFFISNSYDLHHCILCWNLKSRRYCIANCQYTKEEYEKLREELLFELIFSGAFSPMYA